MANNASKGLNRSDGRLPDQLRPVRITPHYSEWAEGSALIEYGRTRVLCTASIDEKLPPFRMGKGIGWLSAEYSMLPRSTHTRTQREAVAGKIGGRTHEIQRLIGRSLRGIVNFVELGERQILIDCDVLQADGGTRTAAISGAYIALALACRKLVKAGELKRLPLIAPIAAVSVGIVSGRPLLDLAYDEDSKAAVDFNVVMLGGNHLGELIEVQGTAEGAPFSRADLNNLLDLAESGLHEIFALQQRTLDEA